MKKLAKGFLIGNGATLLLYALVFLIKPGTLGEIVGFIPNSPNAPVEVMAFYGGFEAGIGLFFIWGSLCNTRLRLLLKAFIFIFLSAGIARLSGIIVHGAEGPSQPVVTIIEISFSVFASWLKQKLPAENIITTK